MDLYKAVAFRVGRNTQKGQTSGFITTGETFEVGYAGGGGGGGGGAELAAPLYPCLSDISSANSHQDVYSVEVTIS